MYVHRLIYCVKMIVLPFPQEAWQGDKTLIYLLIKVSNEVFTFVKQRLLGLFWREESNNRALFVKLLLHCKLCECLIPSVTVKSISCVCCTTSIILSAHRVLQSYALFSFPRTTSSVLVNLNGFAVSSFFIYPLLCILGHLEDPGRLAI